MGKVLADNPAVLHYTGHGTIFQNEEVLVLWRTHAPGYKGEAGWAPFGRKEILDIKVGLQDEKLFRNSPFVMLNACFLAHTREHGGQREDLAAALLEEGAAAVVASPKSIFEKMGVILDESLYSPDYWPADGAMAEVFLAARQKIESKFRGKKTWPAWTMLAYHGNPYTVMPHAPTCG
jgi:hypothetical protein